MSPEADTQTRPTTTPLTREAARERLDDGDIAALLSEIDAGRHGERDQALALVEDEINRWRPFRFLNEIAREIRRIIRG